jgi:hypothetical protein
MVGSQMPDGLVSGGGKVNCMYLGKERVDC